MNLAGKLIRRALGSTTASVLLTLVSFGFLVILAVRFVLSQLGG